MDAVGVSLRVLLRIACGGVDFASLVVAVRGARYVVAPDIRDQKMPAIDYPGQFERPRDVVEGICG
jgi:predicted nicotinamide N-methyase